MASLPRPPVLLAAVGDTHDPATWSGIPYHFLQEARAAGLLEDGLSLRAEGAPYAVRRVAWNGWRALLGDRRGGYQYSEAFLERLWRGIRRAHPDSAFVNCYQLYPPSIIRDAAHPKWWFIDQTLLQLFDAYGVRPRVGGRIAEDALAREREGYQTAAGIVAHSEWAARSLVEDYGVERARIRVVQPGANLDPAAYAVWEKSAASRPLDDRPVDLVCVGKDWRRKGIDRLLTAFAMVRRSRDDVRLRLIGCPRASLPPEIQNVEGVEYVGFVDKRGRAQDFFDMVAAADIGCLVSRAEAGGIALREYHALGLVTLATDAGGAPEHALAPASRSVSSRATPEELAQTIDALVADRKALTRLKSEAWRLRREALWSRTVQRLQATGGFGAGSRSEAHA